MVERHFHELLEDFNTKILEMAALAEESIFKATESLKQQNMLFAQDVLDHDEKIDLLENSIEEMGIDLLVRQQPMASDLRFITTGMKINGELERIADLSVNIAQRVQELGDQPLLKPLIDIPRLSDIAREMVREAINAFVEKDEALAKKVILSDTESDDLRTQVQQELIYDYIYKDGECAPRAVPLLLIARHLERMCDHATYIAEAIVYMVQAEVVKHHHEKLQDVSGDDDRPVTSEPKELQ